MAPAPSGKVKAGATAPTASGDVVAFEGELLDARGATRGRAGVESAVFFVGAAGFSVEAAFFLVEALIARSFVTFFVEAFALDTLLFVLTRWVTLVAEALACAGRALETASFNGGLFFVPFPEAWELLAALVAAWEGAFLVARDFVAEGGAMAGAR